MNDNHTKQVQQGAYQYQNLYSPSNQYQYQIPPLSKVKTYDFGKLIILTLLTFGFYGLNALTVMSNTNNEIAVRLKKENVISLTIALAISIIAPLGMLGVMMIGQAESQLLGKIGSILFVVSLFAPFIILPVCFYKYSKQQCEILRTLNKKVVPSDNPIILLFISFIPFYSYYVFCENYNTGVNAFIEWQEKHSINNSQTES